MATKNKKEEKRTFLTEEEQGKRMQLITMANTLESSYRDLGLMMTSFFNRLDETKSLQIATAEFHKTQVDELTEKYGNVEITDEGEVIVIPEEVK